MTSKLSPERFDFMAKLLYVYQYDKQYKTTFFTELYKGHMQTFNGCKEAPDSTVFGCGVTKNGIQDFFDAFHSLLDDMKKNGFRSDCAIPVGSDGLLENGTHRMIAAYYYNIEPKITQVHHPGQRYDYTFFLGRKGFPAIERIHADTMALEYVNHEPNTRCMVLYPCAYNLQNINMVFNIVQKYGYIYYHKEVKLNSIGLNNLIKELYRGEEWIGGHFPTTGAYGKYKLACTSTDPIVYISIVMKDVSQCIEMKEECRKIYNKGKHSLHVSDFTEDTFRISSALLNENSVNFLNNCKSNMVANNSKNLSNDTKEKLLTYFHENASRKRDCCLGGDIVKELYGIPVPERGNMQCIDRHSDDSEKDKTHPDDIIYNPRNHFYFNGYKFHTINNNK